MKKLLSLEEREQVVCILLSWLSVQNFNSNLQELLEFIPVFKQDEPFAYENVDEFLFNVECLHLEVRFSEGDGFGTIIVDLNTQLIEEKHSEFTEENKIYPFRNLEHLRNFFANFEI